MADFQTQEGNRGKKGGIIRKTMRVDMTPMVDLGFLLITFFMFTTNFSKPNVMDIAFPAKGPHAPTEIDYRNQITFILGKDGKVFYYQDEKSKLNSRSLIPISFDHFQVAKTIEAARAKAPKQDFFTIIIKPADDSQYRTMVDMLDELAITKSQRYGIAEMNDKEKELYLEKLN